MTMSSETKMFTPFANPERQFQNRKDNTPIYFHNIYSFYESESSESDTKEASAVDIETLTLEQYLALNRNDTSGGIKRPKIGLTAVKALESIQEMVDHSHKWHDEECDQGILSNRNLEEKVARLAQALVVQKFNQETPVEDNTPNNSNPIRQECAMELEPPCKTPIHKVETFTEKVKKRIMRDQVNGEKLLKKLETVLQNELPPKEKDTGSIVLPCIIGNTTVSNALADLGESISVMPFSMFKQLGIGNLKPINMVIEMAYRSMQSPKGTYEEDSWNGMMPKEIWEAIRTRDMTDSNNYFTVGSHGAEYQSEDAIIIWTETGDSNVVYGMKKFYRKTRRRQKGTHDGKKKRDSFYQHQEAGKQEKNQMGLLTMDDGIVNWGEHTGKIEETKSCTHGYQLQ
ncbi:retrovirus-related pol polyprotein from transposon TNT 1-94 [Tanacetum coccineum]